MEFLPIPIQEYADAHTRLGAPYLAELERETYLKVLYPRMLSGHIQGRILSFISRLARPKHILEIGTYTGYSALCLSEGLAAEGKLTTIELDPELAGMILKYFEQAGIQDRAELKIGSALTILPTLDGPFDLVFLDADKENYLNYYEAVLPKMPSGGIILADNVLWSGKVLDPAIQDKETAGLRAFSDYVQKDGRVDNLLLPVRDGIMVVIKK